MVNLTIIGNNFGTKVHLPAFKQIEGVNIVSICHNHNWLDIMEDENINAVSIAVPPFKSFDIIKSAIQNKKHIFCEKPICASLQEVKYLCELLEDDIITAVNFEMCESRVIKKLKELINNKNIKKYTLTWKIVDYGSKNSNSWKSDKNLGGGLLNNFGSHIYNLLEYIFNDKIINTDINLKNDFLSFLTFFPTFVGHNLIQYHNLNTQIFNLIIHCDDKKFILENSTNSLKNFTLIEEINGKQIIIEKEEDLSDIDGRIDLTSSLARKFIMGIKEKRQIRPNFRDGLRVRELMECS